MDPDPKGITADPLQRILPRLLAIPDADVEPPDIPAEVGLQEASDMLVFVEPRKDLMFDAGLAPATIEEAGVAIEATRRAESLWTMVSSPRKPEDQKTLENRGREARSNAVSACRWSLREDTNVRATLDRIVQGDGTADLIQDLVDLGTLVEQNLPGLAANRRFAARERVPELRTLAQDISLGLAEYRTADAKNHALDIRNRAWTYLEDRLDEIRLCGRYVFGGTPEAKQFGSAYERRIAQRGRKRRAEMKAAEAAAAAAATAAASNATSAASGPSAASTDKAPPAI